MFWSIDDRNSACDHRKIEIYDLHLCFDLLMISRKWIYHRWYYYLDRSNGISIIRWLFENWEFVRRRLKILLIVEVDRLLVIQKTVDRLILSMWAKFLRSDKKLAAKIDLKSATVCVQHWTYVGITKKNLDILIWNSAKQNNNHLVSIVT